MKAYVDKDICIGCGVCTDICPNVYRMNDEGFAEAYGDITPDLKSCAQEGCDSCPVTAITIEE